MCERCRTLPAKLLDGRASGSFVHLAHLRERLRKPCRTGVPRGVPPYCRDRPQQSRLTEAAQALGIPARQGGGVLGFSRGCGLKGPALHMWSSMAVEDFKRSEPPGPGREAFGHLLRLWVGGAAR